MNENTQELWLIRNENNERITKVPDDIANSLEVARWFSETVSAMGGKVDEYHMETINGGELNERANRIFH